MSKRQRKPDRASERTKEAPRVVLDEATRARRANRALESLEMNNHHPDPCADENKEPPSKSWQAFLKKYNNKTLSQLVELDLQSNPNGPNYMMAASPSPQTPPRRFCAVCGYISPYTCPTCGARYCCVRCYKVHKDTRCLKYVA